MNEFKRVFLEVVTVVAVALIVGLIANAANPDGLKLGRKYFRAPRTQPAPISTQPVTTATATADDDPVLRLLLDRDLQPMSHAEAVAVFEDDLYAAQAYIFIDARNDEHYLKGHIPDAYQLDYYHIERYIDAVLAACQGAEKIVVYCNGDDCDDSMLAAQALIEEHFVDSNKVFVYVGGMTAWRKNNMPIETGHQSSGQITGGQHE